MKKTGFTLTEMLVVLVIIGVIIAIAVPVSLQAIRRANIGACAANIRAIDTACQLQFSQNRVASSGANILPFLEGGALPVCPFNVNYTIAAGGGGAGDERCNKEEHFAAGNWPHTHID